MIVAALALGALIGISLGALGGGGSILTVPALVYALGVNAHQATAASLVIVGVTALTGAVSHARAGHVRWKEGLVFGVLGVAGSYLGSRLSAGVNSHVLLTAFAGLMLVAAAAMTLRQRRATTQRTAPATADARMLATVPAAVGAGAGIGTGVGFGYGDAVAAPGTGAGAAGREGQPASVPAGRTDSDSSTSPLRVARVVLAATVVGFLTGFFGVGGGFVVVPALVLALNFAMGDAVGTSLLVIAVNTVIALAARGHLHLDLPVVVPFTVGAMLATVVGTALAHRVDGGRLVRAFVLLLLALSVYVLARALPPLLS